MSTLSSLDSEDNRGTLVIRTLAMPAHTNANGDIFGGWVLSQMDLGGAILAKKIARNRVTTVAIFSMVFLEPIKVGDVFSCYATLRQVGKTSMQIKVDAWVQHWENHQEKQVTEGTFTYVALNKSGQPTPVYSSDNPIPHPP